MSVAHALAPGDERAPKKYYVDFMETQANKHNYLNMLYDVIQGMKYITLQPGDIITTQVSGRRRPYNNIYFINKEGRPAYFQYTEDEELVCPERIDDEPINLYSYHVSAIWLPSANLYQRLLQLPVHKHDDLINYIETGNIRIYYIGEFDAYDHGVIIHHDYIEFSVGPEFIRYRGNGDLFEKIPNGMFYCSVERGKLIGAKDYTNEWVDENMELMKEDENEELTSEYVDDVGDVDDWTDDIDLF